MSYELEDLEANQPLGLFTNATPLTAEFRVSPAESRNFVVAVTVSAVTGAGPTYANPIVQTTWDDGDTWVTVSDVELQAVTGTGTFLAYATAISSPVSPRCRLVLTPVAAHTITVSDLTKARFAPGYGPASAPPNTTGGSTTVAINSPLGAQLEATSVGVALATDQATQTAPLGVRETDGTDWLGAIATAAAQLTFGAVNKVRQAASLILGWDGTTHRELRVETTGALRMAGLVPESWLGLTITQVSTTQETYEYFEDAAKLTSICTVTVDYVDSTREHISSVTRA